MVVTYMGMYAICHNINRCSKKWKDIIIHLGEMQPLVQFKNTVEMSAIEIGKIDIYIYIFQKSAQISKTAFAQNIPSYKFKTFSSNLDIQLLKKCKPPLTY